MSTLRPVCCLVTLLLGLVFPIGTTAHATADPSYCDAVLLWDSKSTAFENEVLRLMNEARAGGHSCGDYGRFRPTKPLLLNRALRCAARKHAADMAVRNYCSHITPEGLTPWDRIKLAGFGDYTAAAENMSVDAMTPMAVIVTLLADPPHCANIMNPRFTQAGVGFATPADGDGDKSFCMQHFANPL